MAALLHQAQLRWAAMLALYVAGAVRELDIARFMRTARGQRHDMVQTDSEAPHWPSANLADTAITVPYRLKAHGRNKRMAPTCSPLMLPFTFLQAHVFGAIGPALAFTYAALLSPIAMILKRPLAVRPVPCSRSLPHLFAVTQVIRAIESAFRLAARPRIHSPFLTMGSVVRPVPSVQGLAMGGAIGGVIAAVTKALRSLAGLRGSTRSAWTIIEEHGEPPTRCAAPWAVPAAPRHFHVHFSMEGA